MTASETRGRGMSNRPTERLGLSVFPVPIGSVEVRTAGDGRPRTIGGYAAVFNRRSQNLGGFVEYVDPRALNKSKSDGWPGVLARWNHKDEFLLGSTRSGTLNVSVDGTGLMYDVDLPFHRSDLYELVQRGDVAHSSFAFQTYEDEWGLDDGGVPKRTLLSVRLMDVAPVSIPAYPDATVGLRSLATYANAPLEDVQRLAATGELRQFLTRTDIDGGKPEGRNPKELLAEMERTRGRPGAQALAEIEQKRVPLSGEEALARTRLMHPGIAAMRSKG